METPGKSGLSPVIPAAIHHAAVMAAPKAAKADALSVNKVMKLNTGNKICQGEGLVYDGVASIGGGCSVSECLPSAVESVGRPDELFA